MKARLLREIFDRYLAPEFRELKLRGHLLYMSDIDYMLRGLFFESSSFDKTAFVVNAFVQPLYIPLDIIDLTLGKRLGVPNEQWWSLTAENEKVVMEEVITLIKAQAHPLLSGLSTPCDFANNAPKLFDAGNNLYFLEALAYGDVLCGNLARANERLQSLLTGIDELATCPEWITQMRERATSIKLQLPDGRSDAIVTLGKWRDSTLSRINLTSG